jgi:hypothetical protein
MEAHTEINANTNTQCVVNFYVILFYVILSADPSEELQVHFKMKYVTDMRLKET